MRAESTILILVVMAACPATAGAAENEHAICWRGKPAPECRGFVVTDFGLQRRLDDDPTGSTDPFHASLDVGYAHNTSAHDAFGGTIYLGTGVDHARVGVRGRFRRWLSREFAIDISPGVLIYGSEDNGYDYKAPGALVTAGIGWKDLVGFTLEAEHARYEDPAQGLNRPARVSDTTWRAGLKLGSAPGVIGTIAIVALFAAAVAAGAGD